MNLRVPQNAGKLLNSCTIGSFSRRAHIHEWVSERFYVDSNDLQIYRMWK
jgi:hypothetical protein